MMGLVQLLKPQRGDMLVVRQLTKCSEPQRGATRRGGRVAPRRGSFSLLTA